MASIAIMIDGAVLNATAYIGGNYLAKALGGGDKAALAGTAEKPLIGWKIRCL